MNQKHFDNLKKIAADYVHDIDAMTTNYQRDAAGDYLYNDDLKQQRKAARTAETARTIEQAAENVKKAANAEVEAMRSTFRKYMTDITNPTALQSLQALISAGVELTPEEVQAFASSGDYAALRSKGRVSAPSMDAFERDMRNILGHFDYLAAYSGPNCELADAITARPWGQSPRVNGAILKSAIPKFPSELDTIAERWAVVKE